MDNPEKLTTLDTNKKHWTQTQNTGQKHKILDTNKKHWTKTQNTGHKHKTLDKNKQIEKHKKEN
jgi:hypothetical protein